MTGQARTKFGTMGSSWDREGDMVIHNWEHDWTMWDLMGDTVVRGWASGGPQAACHRKRPLD